MQRDKRLPFLVSSVVCVRSWLGRIAHLENPLMDRVLGCHGDIMSAQCLPMWPRPLLLHWPVFHSRCCCFPWIRSWIFAVWTVRLEMDLRHSSCWGYRPHLHSRTHSRSLSTKPTRRGLTNPGRFTLRPDPPDPSIQGCLVRYDLRARKMAHGKIPLYYSRSDKRETVSIGATVH